MIKQVIVLREDLNMSRGKLCAQACHACLASYLEAMRKDKNVVGEWLKEGQKKIILKVNSLEELLTLYEKARQNGLPCAIIKDAGLTELEPGTVTALGIGPWHEKEIDKITGNLPTLK